MLHFEKKLFSASIATRWGDQDIYGHINNVAYFRYMEEARVQWYASIGYPVNATDNGPVIAHTECQYLRAIEYPNTVICHCYLGDISKTSFTILHQLTTASEPGAIFTKAKVQNVWFDMHREKPTAIPDKLRQYLTSV